MFMVVRMSECLSEPLLHRNWGAHSVRRRTVRVSEGVSAERSDFRTCSSPLHLPPVGRDSGPYRYFNSLLLFQFTAVPKG
jgi:hypothetical protein